MTTATETPTKKYRYRGAGVQRLELGKNISAVILDPNNPIFTVTDAQLAQLNRTPEWKQLLLDAILLEQSLYDVKPENIAFIESRSAELAIEHCFDIELLRKYAKNAYSKKLRVLIIKQVDLIAEKTKDINDLFPKMSLEDAVKSGTEEDILGAIFRATKTEIPELKKLAKDKRPQVKAKASEQIQILTSKDVK